MHATHGCKIPFSKMTRNKQGSAGVNAKFKNKIRLNKSIYENLIFKVILNRIYLYINYLTEYISSVSTSHFHNTTEQKALTVIFIPHATSCGGYKAFDPSVS